jgi:hypothetical protein
MSLRADCSENADGFHGRVGQPSVASGQKNLRLKKSFANSADHFPTHDYKTKRPSAQCGGSDRSSRIMPRAAVLPRGPAPCCASRCR